MTIKDKITGRLRSLESEYGMKVLYAVEAGSRAWGFASADSDYDVRFVYVRPRGWYLGVLDRQDTLDFPLDGELDFSGWDFRKALGLFMKSNGALLEWLYSPLVYHDYRGVGALWRALVPDVMDPRALASHYLGLAKRVWFGELQKDKVTAKKYLYALRAVLAARWVIQRRVPAPVPFNHLMERGELPGDVAGRASALVGMKRMSTELSEVGRDPVLHPFLERELENLGGLVQLMEHRDVGPEVLDAFFNGVLEDEERLAYQEPELLVLS